MILGLIPARGGSKGIPRKNLAECAGRPLIYWTIRAALESKLLDRFVVSTEDNEIAEVSRGFGAEVWRRPAELATDDATTIAVMQHIVEQIDCDVLVLLQPTSPIRFRGLIDRAINHFLNLGCDSLATGFISYHYEWGTMPNIPRQEMQGFFYDDGNVYVHKTDHIKRGEWYGEDRRQYITEPWYNLEIDTVADLWAAQGIIWQWNK